LKTIKELSDFLNYLVAYETTLLTVERLMFSKAKEANTNPQTTRKWHLVVEDRLSRIASTNHLLDLISPFNAIEEVSPHEVISFMFNVSMYLTKLYLIVIPEKSYIDTADLFNEGRISRDTYRIFALYHQVFTLLDTGTCEIHQAVLKHLEKGGDQNNEINRPA